ncbi:MAG TPA: ferric reductase-like transmembrane domain-containing protein [Candidatus Saccharimonadales bacterium]
MYQSSLFNFGHYIATSASQVAINRISTSWPWYVIRGAGFLAAALLILLMISGIGQVTGIIYRYIEPVKVWAIHKAMAIALLIAIAIHIGFLLIDHFVSFNLVQILVPFASHYSNGTKLFGLPLGAIAVTMGVLAMYGAIILVASSLGWIDSRKTTWRKLHYISYAVILLVFLHALYAGSDLKYGIFRAGWIFLSLLLLVAIVVRLWRAGTLKRGRKD